MKNSLFKTSQEDNKMQRKELMERIKEMLSNLGVLLEEVRFIQKDIPQIDEFKDLSIKLEYVEETLCDACIENILDESYDEFKKLVHY